MSISGRIFIPSYLFIHCTAPGTIGVLVCVMREVSDGDARYWCFYLFCLPRSAFFSPVLIIVHVTIVVIKKRGQLPGTLRKLFGSFLKKKFEQVLTVISSY